MESASNDRRRCELGRIAWAVTAVACLTALPLDRMHDLTLIAAYAGWFLHLLDAKLGDIDEGRYTPFTAGWPLLAAAVVSSILGLDPSPWVSVPLAAALIWLVWRAWMDVRRV